MIFKEPEIYSLELSDSFINPYTPKHVARELRIVFCVRIESRIESAVRFDFESNFQIESPYIPRKP